MRQVEEKKGPTPKDLGWNYGDDDDEEGKGGEQLTEG